MKKFTTVPEVLQVLEKHKPMSRETVYVHLRALKIRPLGARQRPQLYPANTATKILKRLGLR